MGSRLLIIKQKLDYLLLNKKLSETAEKVIRECKKDFKWLRYAEEENGVYKFLPNCEERWETLEKIAKQVKEQSDFSISYISKNLSYLVNTRVIDEIKKNNLNLERSIRDEYRYYLMSTLLDTRVVDKYIPGYYWLMINKKLYGDRYGVFDFSDCTTRIFDRRISKKYIFYEEVAS
jgi:hypothetical protein